MAVIFVAHGLTSSGKTEVANYLEVYYGIQHFHPIGFVKRQYETLLQKPFGFLDSDEGKAYPIPGNPDKSMQELMVALYHFYREWLPTYSSLNMAVELPELLSHSNVCVVSLRNPREIEELIRIRDEGNHKLVVLLLSREGARKETSDEHHNLIRDELIRVADESIQLRNDGSLFRLHNNLDNIMNYHLP